MAVRFHKHGGEDYIEISSPNDQFTKADRAVKPGDAERWPEAWAAYQAEQNPPPPAKAKRRRSRKKAGA